MIKKLALILTLLVFAICVVGCKKDKDNGSDKSSTNNNSSVPIVIVDDDDTESELTQSEKDAIDSAWSGTTPEANIEVGSTPSSTNSNTSSSDKSNSQSSNTNSSSDNSNNQSSKEDDGYFAGTY